ncbi:unnamed protein product [Amoebophrya sp. A25]|nr:unnamed protein product [Amoebophrya sp. A25]|eukprot:GSA25T00003032001.1
MQALPRTIVSLPWNTFGKGSRRIVKEKRFFLSSEGKTASKSSQLTPPIIANSHWPKSDSQ